MLQCIYNLSLHFVFTFRLYKLSLPLNITFCDFDDFKRYINKYLNKIIIQHKNLVVKTIF